MENKENKYKRLIKDTLIFAVGGVGSKMILFFLVPLYTNYLSTEEYGIADLIFTASQFIIPFVGVVIHDAVLRFGLSKEEQKEDVLLCGLIVSGVGAIATILITPLLGLYDSIAKWKWYLCIYVIITLFQYIEMFYIKAKEQNKLFAIMSIIQTLTMALSNVLFIVIIPLGVDGYVFANIIGTLTATVGMFIFGKIYRDIRNAKFSGSLLKRMLLFSAPLILNNVSWWAMQSANKIIVELMLGASVLGIYTVATKIPSLINTMISFFQSSWGISSVKEIESSNDSKFYSDIFNAFSFLAFFISIGLILGIKPVMTVYVGGDFVESWIYIPLLLASAAFSAISSYFVSLYSALKKSVNNMITTLISAATNIVVSIVLINYIGLWGAIVGTFVAYFLMAVIRMIDVTRFIKMKLNIGRFVLNSIILITDAVLVSFEIQIYLVSSIALVLFLLVNYKQIKVIAMRTYNSFSETERSIKKIGKG